MNRLIAGYVLLTSTCLAGMALAQSPFGGPQMPAPGQVQKCTPEYSKSVEAQIKSLEQWRTTAPETIGQICRLIDTAGAFLGEEIPEGIREQLKSTLGINVDMRFVRAQCRQSQGDLDRELTTQLGYLRSELERCDPRI